MNDFDTSQMAVEWDERAARDALHYIHTGRSSWDDADEFFDTGEKLAQQIVDPVIQRYIKRPKDSVAIDIGCGVGRVTRALSPRFKLVYGFDVSGKMIELGKSMNSAYGNIQFHQNDGQHLEVIADSSIDYVFSFTTFQHMPSREVVESNISEISRVLKPGGVLQLDLPIVSGWRKLRGTIPIPRAIKTLLPHTFLRIYRVYTVSDPLKRTETFGGVTFRKSAAQRLLSDFGLKCNFQNHPFTSEKLMVLSVKCQ